MSHPPVVFRPYYWEQKRETDDVEMAIPARRPCVRAAMELRRDLFARDHRREPARSVAVHERGPDWQLPPRRSDRDVDRRRHYGRSIGRLRSVHATGHDDG